APAYAQRGVASILLSDRQYGNIPDEQAEAQAKLYIDQALRLDPEQPEALAAQGLYHLNRPGETNLAIEPLEAALAINPNLVNASNWLQSAYSEAGRLTETMAILEDLRVRDPLYRPGIANLNNFYIFQSRLDDAKAQIEHVKPFMPNDPFLLRLEANVLYSTGDYAEGLKVAEQALAIQPDNFPNIGLVGRGLDATGQFERMVEEAPEDQRWFALIQLGRMEEATLLVQKLAASGEDPGSMIGLLANYGRQAEAVAFIEQRWGALDKFVEAYPVVGGGSISSMLDLAYAYASVGDESGFNQAMEYSRSALDSLADLGYTNSYLEFINGVYYALNGDHEAAIERLASAVDGGYLTATKLSEGWEALTVLEGDPEYQAIQQRMIDHLNAERAELGLDPLFS
ncbi:MAG TPA: hypothetical protein VKN35_07625, partial [Xanthomonadales bacterium]|nr:hypothetical protein [Xanthomonadales bacterium]